MSEQPCDGCGGQGGHTESSQDGGVYRQWWVRCQDCNGRGTK